MRRFLVAKKEKASSIMKNLKRLRQERIGNMEGEN
jgi:hypothetical protein